MNPHLRRLNPYPFERLRALLAGVEPAAATAIPLHIGEPRHPAPGFVLERLRDAITTGTDSYPPIAGSAALREAIADWLSQRFAVPRRSIDAETMVVPVSGTREALFSFALAVLEPGGGSYLAMPNPAYQIYEGAAILAGAEPLYLTCDAYNDYAPDLDAVSAQAWNKCELLYLCTPANPTGNVLTHDYLSHALELADRYGFVLGCDECYSELYLDASAPPPGLLQVAHATGRDEFERCVVFHSLSKRSNVPGLRSGFVAGDKMLLAQYSKYRSYHGVALPFPTQLASIAAWKDEAHVRENRDLYRAKFEKVVPILAKALDASVPEATFYLWLAVGGDDERFARGLFEAKNVTVLPGSYMARPSPRGNPGSGRIRVSLVATENACVEAAQRIVEFASDWRA